VPGALWHTRFDNLAPQIGTAYQVTPKTVVRGGFGLYYDLGYGGDTKDFVNFPYDRFSFLSFSSPVSFDLANRVFQPPPFTADITPNALYISAVDPNLRPVTMQWNTAIERELGANQRLTATYVGADAMRLLRTDTILPPLLVALGTGANAIRPISRCGGGST
jgi:hypothetical protein